MIVIIEVGGKLRTFSLDAVRVHENAPPQAGIYGETAPYNTLVFSKHIPNFGWRTVAYFKKESVLAWFPENSDAVKAILMGNMLADGAKDDVVACDTQTNGLQAGDRAEPRGEKPGTGGQ